LNELRRPKQLTGPAHRRKKRGAFARVFSSLFMLVALVAIGGVALGVYGMKKYGDAGPLAADTVFEVRKGLRTQEIGAELEKAGIISNGNLFAAAALATGTRSRLKAGEYQFTKAMSMKDVLDLLVSGRYITYKVTVPEGWTTMQALDRLRENGILAGDITIDAGEGQILPDTYIFQRGETRDNILRGMINARQKVIDELWPQRDPGIPIKTPEEAMILASIVEKETGIAEERPRVASVFVNRLKAGMRLQSDPTIIYGITLGKVKLDRPLTREDIAAKTPYNTYQINGLPPGPIANPGREAIAATLQPAKTKDLYFVADGTGGHVFAETLEEHNKNVAKWREIEKQRREAAGLAPLDDLTAPDQTAAGEEPAPAAGAQTDAPQDAAGAESATGAQASDAEQAQANAADAPAQAAPEPEQTGSTDIGGSEGAEPATDLSSMPQPAETEEASAADNQTKAVPIPKAKPTTLAAVEEVADAPEAEIKEANLKPGSVIRMAKRLVPVPMPKPASH
jgi:UPF0755 protein